jgi:Holliday junction DNA helicase RuvA
MIAGLRGTLAGKDRDSILIDVGGVIYRVGTSANTLSELGDVGEPVRVVTHLVVREDQMTLFGFITNEELLLFETLISVTGIGPRLSCAVLSHFKVETLLVAIDSSDVDLLATVPGVGKKTAARLIVELRGKLPSPTGQPLPVNLADREVVQALRALGYTTSEVNSVIGRLTVDASASVEEKVVAALRELGQ